MAVKQKNTGLGRGLDALFSSEEVLVQFNAPVSEGGEYIINISLSDIDINKNQPRKNFDKGALEELAASIKENGLLQPIAVQQIGERYQIIAGERRFRAFKLLNEPKIPAIIKNLSRQQVMQMALIENLQREDLTAIEEAEAMKALMEEFGLTQQELAQKLGKARSSIANSLRLLELHPEVKKLVDMGSISAGHARAILSIDEPEMQIKLARQAAASKLSVRQVESMARQHKLNNIYKELPHRVTELTSFEDMLCRKLGTRVKIAGTVKKGKVEIDYYSMDELEGLIKILMTEPENAAKTIM